MSEEIGIEEITKIIVRAVQKAMNEDFEAPNFLTTTVVDTSSNEKFEFTVRRHEGMTPEEKLKILEEKLRKYEEMEE